MRLQHIIRIVGLAVVDIVVVIIIIMVIIFIVMVKFVVQTSDWAKVISSKAHLQHKP